MDAVILEKGHKVVLEKEDGSELTIVSVGAGWDFKSEDKKVDVDLFSFTVVDKQIIHTTYFGARFKPGTELSEDNRTGEGDGYDEVLKIFLNDLPADAQVYVGVNIWSGAKNFGLIQNLNTGLHYKAVKTKSVAETLDAAMKFDLSEDFSAYNGVMLYRMYKHNGVWKVEALGTGLNGKITEIGSALEMALAQN